MKPMRRVSLNEGGTKEASVPVNQLFDVYISQTDQGEEKTVTKT